MGRARFGDIAIFEDPADSDALKIAPGASVTVYEAGTTTPIAQTLYAGPTGGTTKTNPFTANLDGTFAFFLDDEQDVNVKVDGSVVGLGVATLPNVPVLAVDVVAAIDFGPEYDASVRNLIAGIWYEPIIEGTDASHATNNTDRLKALFAAAASIRHFRIRMPANSLNKSWWFTKDIDLTTGASTCSPQLVGDGARLTRVMLSGATGPWFTFQKTGAGSWDRPQIKDFSVYHDQNATGADMLQYISAGEVTYENVEWYPDVIETPISQAGADPSGLNNYSGNHGADTCIETRGNSYINHCKLSSKVHGTPRSLVISPSLGQTEILIGDRSVISTAPATVAATYNAGTHLWTVTSRSGGGTNIDIAPTGTGRVDLIAIRDKSQITGGNKSIRNISNTIVFQLRIEDCQLDVAMNHIWSVPTSGAESLPGIRTTVVQNCWAHADDTMFVFAGGGAAGTPAGSFHTSVVLTQIETNGGHKNFVNAQNAGHVQVSKCNLGFLPELPTGSDSLIYFSGLGELDVDGNRIRVVPGANTKHVVEVGPSTSEVSVQGNFVSIPTRGYKWISAPGARTSGKGIKNNVITDPDGLAMDAPRSDFGDHMLGIHPAAAIVWAPGWVDTTGSRTLDPSRRQVTWQHDVSANARQFLIADDAQMLEFAGLASNRGTIADAADLSFVGTGFSGHVLAAVAGTGIRTFFCKADGSTYEYWFGVDATDKLFLVVYTNAANLITRVSSSALTSLVPHLDGPNLYGFTSANTDANGIALYVNGEVVASSGGASGAFTGMANTAAAFEIGSHLGGTADHMNGKIGSLVLETGVSTPTQIARGRHRINSHFRLGLGVS